MKIMGILNVTPDSFSDGGAYFSPEEAFNRAHRLWQEGADIVDIGGESTRPGAHPVSVQCELDRIIPIIEKIHTELPVTISVDTRKALVMQEAIKAGARMINDVSALQEEGSLAVVAAHADVQVWLMHKQGEPLTMQIEPHYHNVVKEVKDFLIGRIQACLQAGIGSHRIGIDPGIGFGKTTTHNLLLIKHLTALTELDYPVLIGVSRKSLIGQVLNKPIHERLYGGLALAVLSLLQGVQVIRTHDVAPTLDAINLAKAVLQVDQEHFNL